MIFTITELISNFRAGLLGLIPSVERVGVPWKRPDAYDEWDRLVAAAYRALVVEPLRWGVPKADFDRVGLAEYDMLLPTYVGKSVIELLPARPNGALRVFHALGTAEAPFDIAEWRSVAPDGSPESDELGTSRLEGTRFALRLYTDRFSTISIEDVSLPRP